MLSSKYWITNCILLTILAFSTFATTLAYAAPLANSDKDWQWVNGNSWAWNYSPQTQINKDNVDNLEVKWVFPVGSKALAPQAMQSILTNEGVATPPLVRNGVVIFETNWLRTYALDAKTGKQLWVYDYSIDVDAIQKRIPVKIGSPHLHGARYWEGGDAVLTNGIACDFDVIDFKTGNQRFRVTDLCQNMPGSIYNYGISGATQESVGTYEKGKQFIFSLNGNTGGWNANGRNVIMGIDMNSRQIVWRVFNQPPQDIQVKDWALQECSIGFFQTTPCSEVATKAPENLEWDWAQPNQPPSKWGGVGSNWGQAVVDEDTGLMYLQTGNQSPYTNVSLTPGPRLYGSTIMAIDMTKGQRVWWLQPMPHDPYDYDCNWSGILAEVKSLGKVYMKGCKEGILYVVDAATGKAKYTKDVHEEIYPGKKTYHLTDPFSRYDMREWGTPENSKYHGAAPVILYPSWLHGTFGTDMSYDPATETLYHYSQLAGVSFSSTPLAEGKGASASTYLSIGNTTIVARDAATGQIKWKYFYPFSAQRSHIVVTNDIIFSGFTDGNVKFFDKNSGNILKQVNVGSGIYVGPTIGKDSDGNSKVFLSVGGIPVIGGRAAPYAGGAQVSVVPGTLIAVGLSDRAAGGVSTTTVTTTTATTSVTTATTTATTTLVTTQPAKTTTITSEVTQTTGLPSEVTYAAVGVAVIALIAAAVLVMRKK